MSCKAAPAQSATCHVSRCVRGSADIDRDETGSLRPLHAAVFTYRIAFGPRVGLKVLTRKGAMPPDSFPRKSLWPTSTDSGCSPRCGVEAHNRGRLEQPCGYITHDDADVHRGGADRIPEPSMRALQCERPNAWCLLDSGNSDEIPRSGR